jgi:ATP adenylyltransferase/5',5'''-P-1,P-4-tetraphosphate phosphorylase II
MADAYSEKALELLASQKAAWDMAISGYGSLDSAEVRSFEFEGYKIKTQFNPGRIRSTAAKVDKKSVGERKCFLCEENRPAAQESIDYGDDFWILVNPFPIFPEHLTLPLRAHEPQRVLPFFPAMLDFARDLADRFTVFYNGPKCGASAPDHMHFQAGTRGFMPIDREFDELKRRYGKTLDEKCGVEATAIDDGLRKIVALEGSDKAALAERFARLHDVLAETIPNEEEPMMNVLVNREGETFRVVVLPRRKHRPERYHAEGERRVLLSPASVDLGGVAIIPVEEDFKRADRSVVEEVFREVFVERETLERIGEAYAG